MAAQAPAVGGRSDRVFYAGMAVAAAGIVFAGFAPSYYLKSWYGTPPLPSPLVHFHGLLFTSWIVLLLTQVTLVAARRTDLHRRLLVASQPLRLSLGGTGAWLALARWLTG